MYINGGVVIIVDLNRATIQEAKELISTLEEEISSRDKRLVVDLGQCEFVDPTFIGVLLVTLKRLKAQGRSLKLVKPNIPKNDSSVVTNILRVFELYKSREEALASLASQKLICQSSSLFFLRLLSKIKNLNK